MWFVLQELEFKICYSSIHLLWGITKTYSLISEALWPIGWWTQAISTLHTFFSSACHFFHSLFALSSIIVSQPNFILHNSCRKIFAVKQTVIRILIHQISKQLFLILSSLLLLSFQTLMIQMWNLSHLFFCIIIKACTL